MHKNALMLSYTFFNYFNFFPLCLAHHGEVYRTNSNTLEYFSSYFSPYIYNFRHIEIDRHAQRECFVTDTLLSIVLIGQYHMDIPNFNGCIIFFGLGYPNLFYYHLVDGLSVSSFLLLQTMLTERSLPICLPCWYFLFYRRNFQEWTCWIKEYVYF